MIKTLVTPCERMAWYNKARLAAKSGKLDAARVNRALGILQSRDGQARLAQYHATVTSCDCPDRVAHVLQPCKHMVARMIEARVVQERSQSLISLLEALAALAAKTTWFAGETYRLTDRLLVTCNGDDVVLCWESATVVIFHMTGFGWVSNLQDVITLADVTCLHEGRPLPVHAKTVMGVRVR